MFIFYLYFHYACIGSRSTNGIRLIPIESHLSDILTARMLNALNWYDKTVFSDKNGLEVIIESVQRKLCNIYNVSNIAIISLIFLRYVYKHDERLFED